MRFSVLLPLLSLAAGCAGAGAAGGRLQVLAAAYPFAWAAEQVAGPDARVIDLVKPGVEPHDIELTPREVGAVEQAGLVVYLHGFQPAVDDAVRDAAAHSRLDLAGPAQVHQPDPHVWLDPVRMQAIVQAIARRLAAVDPAHAADYTRRAADTVARLQALDALLRDRLRGCRQRSIVTAHTAFAYLAARYGLTQVGVTGLSADSEPSPGRLARVARYARSHGVTTVFFESLIDPKLAQTVATEVGARTAVLDPVEGVRPGDDYLSVMRRNVAALHEGLSCA